jgi:hypothetical protein
MRWELPETPTKRERALAKRLKRASKFFGFLWEIRAELFNEAFQDELSACYQPRGQQPVPPALLAMVWLLQAYTGLSDRDAVDAAVYDQRWQLVLGTLGLDEAPFGQGSLPRFRARMVSHDLDQRLVGRTVELARETGLFGWRNLKGALDSSPLRGAGRVEDTWNLLGRALSNLVDAIAVVVGTDRSVLLEELELDALAGKSLKSVLDIDWDVPEERAAALLRLVEDAERLKTWVMERPDLKLDTPPLSTALADLKRVIEQDTEPDPDGSGVRIRRGTARDRMPSLGDREMRHGRKSKSKKFVGYKRHFAVIEGARLVADGLALPANVPEHQATEPLLRALRKHGELKTLDIDRGYLGSPEVPALDAEGVVIRCKAWPARNRGRYAKTNFKIDLKAGTVTCPAEQVVEVRVTKTGRRAVFPKATCHSCPQRAACTTSKRGRTVQLHPQEDLLQRLRALQATPEGRAGLRERVVVEHSLARLQRMQGSRARYKGARKNTMDLRRYAALNNLQEIHRHKLAA